jgi:hypothetical protein
MDISNITAIIAVVISLVTALFVFIKNRQDLQLPFKISAYTKYIDAISFQENCIRSKKTEKFKEATDRVIDAISNLTLVAPNKILLLCYELRDIKDDTTTEDIDIIRNKLLHEIRKDLKADSVKIDLSKLLQ